MKVIVGEHKCTIDKTPVNELEVNVTKVEFEFDEKIPASYAKKAFFTQGNVSKEVLLENNECDIPNEVLYQKGQVRLGVIAYEVQNGELIERFNPTPTYFPVWEGSLTEADNTEPITPTDKEQIESAIANIQAEQVTQNQNISQNTSDIGSLEANKQDKLISGQNIKTINNESLLGAGNLEVITDLSDYYTKGQTDDLLDDKADRSEIPDVSEFITKDVDNLTNYTKTNDMNTAINTAVGNERTSRESSDVALQNQIDAITASSDVVDVVSTYQELLDYDTSSLTENDIIKVMQDETHSNAISYFRWQLSTWNYIGSEGPFYTKGETDTLLNTKANVSDIPDLTNYVKNTDYANSSTGGVIKTSLGAGTTISNGALIAQTKAFSEYGNASSGLMIGKGTLENVITGKQLVNQTTLEDSQAEQDTTIEGLQAELDRYKMLENALPHTENETESDYVTLENTAKSPMEIGTIPQTSQETTTGAQVYDINNDDISVNPDFVIDSDDWISLTFNNTGESAVFYNFYKTIPKIKNDTNYNVIVEIANVSGTGDFYVISAGGSSVFTNGYILSLNNTSSNTIYNEIRTTKSDAETSGSLGMRTFVRARTGESGSIKFRLSLLEDTTITPSTFVYQKYTGTLPSPNPDYPQEINRTTGENQVKVIGKNLFDEQTEVGKIYITTGTNQSSSINLRSKNFTPIKPSTNYYLYNGYFVGSPSSRILVFFYDKNYQFLHTTNASNVSFTSPSNAYYLRFYCNDSYGTTYRNDICLEESSTAITYVAHEETTYPISLGNKEMFNINNVYDGFVYDESVDKFYFRRWNRKIELAIADMNNSENYPGWKSTPQILQLYEDIYKTNLGGTLSNYTNYYSEISTFNQGYSVNFSNAETSLLYLSRSIWGEDHVQTYWKTNYPNLVVALAYNLKTYIDEEITDATLISQLRAIKNALSMQGTTHIISTSSGTNLPFLIKARAVQNISNS